LPASILRLHEEEKVFRRDWETEWHTSFTNVKSLEVVLKISDRRKHASGSIVELDYAEMYNNLTESTEMVLQANKFIDTI
jgi:hypothetical protein